MAQRTFLIVYGYVPEMSERRTPHRSAHLAHVKDAEASGRLTFAAATMDPVDAAYLVVSAPNEADVHAWIAADPYMKAGLIRSVVIREIAVVTGARP